MRKGELSPEQEQKLQADIGNLKDPAPYRQKFETERIQELTQALDILARLRREAWKGGPSIPHQKLFHAWDYLNGLLKEESKKENEPETKRG